MAKLADLSEKYIEYAWLGSVWEWEKKLVRKTVPENNIPSNVISLRPRWRQRLWRNALK